MSGRRGRTGGNLWTAAFMAAVLFWGPAVALHAQMHDHGTGGEGASTGPAGFERGIEGLPAAEASREIALADGAVFDLRAAPVSARISGRALRMYAYGGSIPGPLLRVKQGSSVTVRFANALDLDSSVHWHGVRVENSSDGVPGVTQQPVRPGGTHTYRLRFPDAGLFWYHPHVREDVAQELGLYGGILVEPAAAAGTPGGWPSVDREVVLFLDDILLRAGDVEPFRRDVVTHAMSGRFGNTFLVNGSTGWTLDVRAGERVRFFLANSAGTRVFSVGIEEQVLKVIGGDAGLAAREALTSSVVLGPSERAVADVLFQAAGTFRLLHRSPSRKVALGTIRVTGAPVAAAGARAAGFFAPGGDEAMAREAAALLARAPAQPDSVLALRAQGGMMGGMGGMGGMMDMGGAPPPIEWEEDGHMAMMNAMSTTRTMRWTIRDRASGREGMDIPLEAAVGQVKVIRIVNEPDGEHPMQHPIHLHGQRFLVAARDGVAETNPSWEDTVLVPAGSTYDLLVVFETAGTWLLHCHIPEHMEAGMMAAFTVKDRG